MHEVTESPENKVHKTVAGEQRMRERVLFDGSSLAGWNVGVYTGADDFDVTEDGVILPQADSLSGMTYVGDLPTSPYALEVEATKRWGADFFLAVTFPVRDSHLTLVLGGWGGSITGLSSIDGLDASANSTTTFQNYPNGKRFSIVIEVRDDRVRALVDDEVVVDEDLQGREVGLRVEVLASKPLGLAAFATSTVVHRVVTRPLGSEARPKAGPKAGLSPASIER